MGYTVDWHFYEPPIYELILFYEIIHWFRKLSHRYRTNVDFNSILRTESVHFFLFYELNCATFSFIIFLQTPQVRKMVLPITNEWKWPVKRNRKRDRPLLCNETPLQ